MNFCYLLVSYLPAGEIFKLIFGGFTAQGRELIQKEPLTIYRQKGRPHKRRIPLRSELAISL